MEKSHTINQNSKTVQNIIK